MNVSAQIPSVNFHLWKPCNMRCRFCFATFQDVGPDVLPKGHLPREGCLSVVEALASAGFDKINFAGGEPTLCPWLPDLLRRAKELALTTSMVTNGSRITPEWLDRLDNSLDWGTLSMDTLDPQKLETSGRTIRAGPLTEDDYLGVIDLLKKRGIRLKINTVVTRCNCHEDLTGFIARARPERWKLLQVLPIRGQNDGLVDDLVITPEQFAGYVARNRGVEAMGVAVVPESNDLMTGSYVMVDPAGRFFDNVAGIHVYSRPINEVGVATALREVSVDPDKFRLRDGRYDW
jgi:radical S-adenosyl methionine domain-containing protein 2